DWIASDSELFPLCKRGVVPPMSLGDDAPSLRAKNAWEKLDFLPGWQPPRSLVGLGRLFSDRFNRPALRPVQIECGRLAQQMSEPGLMIVEAPMGEGKTEAAMLAAEILAERFGLLCCYWALPTQATSNAMFERMLAWLSHLPDKTGRGSQAVALVHSKAFLNEAYTS